MRSANAIKVHRKSGVAEGRDLQCAIRMPTFSVLQPRSPLSSRGSYPQRLNLPTCICSLLDGACEEEKLAFPLSTTPSYLSSRPERSGGEGSAVRHSDAPPFRSTTTFSFVISGKLSPRLNLPTCIYSLLDDACNVEKLAFPLSTTPSYLSSRPERTRISCHAVLDKAAGAPFS